MAACIPNIEGRRKLRARRTSKSSFSKFITDLTGELDGVKDQLKPIDKDIAEMEVFMYYVEHTFVEPELIKKDEAIMTRKGLVKLQKDLLIYKDILIDIQKKLDCYRSDLITKETELSEEMKLKEKTHIIQQFKETTVEHEISGRTGFAEHLEVEKEEGVSGAGSFGHLDVETEDVGGVGFAGHSDTVVDEGASGHLDIEKDLKEQDPEPKLMLLSEVRTQLEDMQRRKNDTWTRNENLLERLRRFLMEKGLDLSAEKSEGEASGLQQAEVKKQEENVYETAVEKSDDGRREK